MGVGGKITYFWNLLKSVFQACMQASKQVSKQARGNTSIWGKVCRQGSSQAQKHLEGIQSEPCPGGACF